MTRGRRHQRHPQWFVHPNGIRTERPLPPSFISTPGLTPPALDGMPPGSVFRPHPPGAPTPVWSPGPIPDSYTQRENIEMRSRNPPVQYTHSMRLVRSPQSDQSSQHSRSAQPIPQIHAVQSFPPIQPVQLVTPMQPMQSVPLSYPIQPNQYSQLVPPSLPHIPLQPVQSYVQHVPVSVAVSYMASPPPAYGPPPYQMNGAGALCAPPTMVGNMGTQLSSQLRADAPEFVPWSQSEQGRGSSKEFNWMVVTST